MCRRNTFNWSRWRVWWNSLGPHDRCMQIWTSPRNEPTLVEVDVGQTFSRFQVPEGIATAFSCAVGRDNSRTIIQSKQITCWFHRLSFRVMTFHDLTMACGLKSYYCYCLNRWTLKMSAETADFCGSDSGFCVSWRFFRFLTCQLVMPFQKGPFFWPSEIHSANLMPLWESPNAWETPQRRHVVATLNFDCSAASVSYGSIWPLDPWNIFRIGSISIYFGRYGSQWH